MNIVTFPPPTALGLDRVTVLLSAADSRFTDLARHLPQDWQVLRCAADQLTRPPREPDIVLLDDPRPEAVTDTCLRHPTAAVMVVLSPYGDHQDVVDVLEAGAVACVRSHTTAVIAAHVEACQRRKAE
jgi:hypothetical protein